MCVCARVLACVPTMCLRTCSACACGVLLFVFLSNSKSPCVGKPRLPVQKRATAGPRHHALCYAKHN